MTATMLRGTSKSALAATLEPTTINAAAINAVRGRKYAADDRRFFHRNASSGRATLDNANGALRALRSALPNLQFPARIALMRAARFCAFAIDASSNATSERSTHT